MIIVCLLMTTRNTNQHIILQGKWRGYQAQPGTSPAGAEASEQLLTLPELGLAPETEVQEGGSPNGFPVNKSRHSWVLQAALLFQLIKVKPRG